MLSLLLILSLSLLSFQLQRHQKHLSLKYLKIPKKCEYFVCNIVAKTYEGDFVTKILGEQTEAVVPVSHVRCSSKKNFFVVMESFEQFNAFSCCFITSQLLELFIKYIDKYLFACLSNMHLQFN